MKRYQMGIACLFLLCMTACREKENKDVTAANSGIIEQDQGVETYNSKPTSQEESSKTFSAQGIKDNQSIVYSGLYPEMVVDRLEYAQEKYKDKVVYLTFDDGPCKSTPELLKVLKELDVKATFFVTAQFGSDRSVVRWLRQITEDGHAVGVHSYSHSCTHIYNSLGNFLDDYKRMDDLIIKATGKRSHVYRFPGGSSTGYNQVIRQELIKDINSRGIVYYDWNAYDGDCDGASETEMVEKSVRESAYKNKTILLMHNTPRKGNVIEALPEIVKQLKEKGYRFDVLDGTVTPIQFIK